MEYPDFGLGFKTYCKKKANVSLDIGFSESPPPEFPLTKCGVAASLPAVSSSRASPVWNAV